MVIQALALRVGSSSPTGKEITGVSNKFSKDGMIPSPITFIQPIKQSKIHMDKELNAHVSKVPVKLRSKKKSLNNHELLK